MNLIFSPSPMRYDSFHSTAPGTQLENELLIESALDRTAVWTFVGNCQFPKMYVSSCVAFVDLR